MADALDRFLAEINRAKLRVKRPSKFVFLCGGVIHEGSRRAADYLRDFLWRKKKLGDGPVAFVLAESAQQLYRDSGYSDLISFEEDIARIAAVVLVISESAGSLAELGAFCSNPVISPVLRVLISEENFSQESFIRWGPVERVRAASRDRVGVFPWTTGGDGSTSLEHTAAPHFDEIVNFINGHVDRAPSTMLYPDDEAVSVFYDILWAIYVAYAVTPIKLFETVSRIYPNLSQSDFKRKLYTLRVADWIRIVPYGGQDYYFLGNQQDPFQYSFNEGVKDKEPVRRVLAIREQCFVAAPPGALARVKTARAT
ncbi:MAG: retron St85 family effector protein [Sphingomicrobium sp.]